MHGTPVDLRVGTDIACLRMQVARDVVVGVQDALAPLREGAPALGTPPARVQVRMISRERVRVNRTSGVCVCICMCICMCVHAWGGWVAGCVGTRTHARHSPPPPPFPCHPGPPGHPHTRAASPTGGGARAHGEGHTSEPGEQHPLLLHWRWQRRRRSCRRCLRWAAGHIVVGAGPRSDVPTPWLWPGHAGLPDVAVGHGRQVGLRGLCECPRG